MLYFIITVLFFSMFKYINYVIYNTNKPNNNARNNIFFFQKKSSVYTSYMCKIIFLISCSKIQKNNFFKNVADSTSNIAFLHFTLLLVISAEIVISCLKNFVLLHILKKYFFFTICSYFLPLCISHAPCTPVTTNFFLN